MPMRPALLVGLTLLPLLCAAPPAAADDEIVCVLKQTETDYYCVEQWETPWGEAICVMRWNTQGTHGEGRCVFLEPLQ